ncbi:glycoside hydrolase family 3 N-terminal domain-containing protein [Pediococcus acidilactici]|uniref:glycoside hydrolase family 3 N-terminal domain-containing protein n=1 Tax=Pediococcus acidilactici TaxID=1254 RepID=UPI0023312D86|nr:glycoside hydrolase family 3 N-terminal domain-containing protein [Pediococcus acidilactici]MDB8859834.1 glycoside hydrolase family 3 N-terminal domain-containing protein [Pediococcus acidilactici]MDB8861228.1 glycoside hydrolase family 3 N-terminal domain-containing protein [Pediococcus acidilactici]MDB8863428.1 glycoside hydrolase family 3 N-terminal domain-containing protein [Pediococcus acidilactici]MDB8866119.1 glycoside hydrolase family 3 N-terminal domain-containing protein [Pediococc
MEETKLRKLFNDLSDAEKVSQTVQLNGDLFVESGVMSTGPKTDLGLPADFNYYEIGSIYNVNNHRKLKKLQTEVLEKSRHRIPLLFMSDIIYGFRTIFPMPLAQAGSYNFDLIQRAAAVTAKESYQNGLHVVFSPMLDLVRDPRWGRVMESPGEDVYTAKEFGRHVVRGYQGDLADGKITHNHVAACIKHFAAYGAPESGREYNAVELSYQKLYNEYLQPYQAAIEAKAQLVMTAFNLLNGVPATGNRWLNREVLRDRFGFEGVLDADYSAIAELVNHGYAANSQEAAQKALRAGVDLDMMTAVYANGLPKVLKNPEMRQLLDEAVWRILVLKNKLGLFENPFRGLDEPATGKILAEEDRALAAQLVEESSVLLKNKSALPLRQDQKIAVIGPYGESKLTLGFWASVSGKSTDVVPLKEGLQAQFNPAQLSFSRGYNLFGSYEPFGPLKQGIEMVNGPIEDENLLLQQAEKQAAAADVVVLTIGENFLESGEGAAKAHLTLPAKQKRLIQAVAKQGKPIVGIVYTGRPLVLTDVEPYFDSLLLVWFPGTMGGTGIANLLSGKASPSARLSMTFPRSEGQLPIYQARTPTGRPLGESNHSDRFVSKYIDESNEPLYPFGSGLSYARFTGRWRELHQATTTLKGKFEVENLSDRAAATVVQIYLKQFPAEIVQPIKRLVKAVKVQFTGAGKQVIDVEIPVAELAYFDNQGEKHLEHIEYQFQLDILGETSEINLKLN